MTTRQATFVGFVAVLLWSLLALFTVGTAPVPPFQLAAMTFLIGGVVGLIWIGLTGALGALRQVGWRVYVFGTLGLFGYHALYFTALRMAPAAEAGLIAYLWPLLIVLFSGLLPGERLQPLHVVGALTSFIGAALIVLGGSRGFGAEALPGFALAFLCALTWSGYSVLSRRLGNTPTASVVVFCLMTAVLATGAHVVWEETVWPVNGLGWAAVLGLGLGPVGLAFYVWDIGVKQGDIQLLGVASYGAPLLSTLILIFAGVADPRLSLVLAGILITAGAVMAARASSAQGTGN
ncbi:EamA family transporter [Aliiroseovarius sediminis]|uniref:aromatic amino acid exporter YddG n=1 Tax=Aliiroseovarius sediminis TaxID=2925839 RepID=UPI001F570150|nr:EamA family transporter [uncultured Aliiroseovarius sp.]MCI2395434.1 EamA family transporter [Aliiroseovarius sediminis]